MQQRELVVDGELDNEYDAVLRGAKDLANAQSASLFLRQGDLLVRVRTNGPGVFATEVRLGQGFIGRVGEAQSLLTVDPRRGLRSVGMDCQPVIGVPLVYRDGLVGVLALMGDKEHAIRSLPFITLLADQFAAVLATGHQSEAERNFANELLRRSEDQAARLARAIQAGALPHLAALDSCLEVLARRRDAEPDTGDDWLTPAREKLQGEIERLRGLSIELRPWSLDVHGIEAALRERATRAEAESETRFAVTSTLAGRPPAALETALYRVADEAIGNVVEHAQATSARLNLASVNGTVTLELRDDGIGFTPRDPEDFAASGGFGFLGMRSRVEALDGTFSLWSRPSYGCKIRAVI